MIRFDGERCHKLEVPGGYAVRALAFDDKERMWVTSNGQVGWFERGPRGGWAEFNSLNSVLPAGAEVSDMWHVFAEPKGAVFISKSQLLRLREDKWEKWDPASVHSETKRSLLTLRSVGGTLGNSALCNPDCYLKKRGGHRITT